MTCRNARARILKLAPSAGRPGLARVDDVPGDVVQDQSMSAVHLPLPGHRRRAVTLRYNFGMS
eukprot:1637828-Pleurochrysis_carterae.AAC.1